MALRSRGITLTVIGIISIGIIAWTIYPSLAQPFNAVGLTPAIFDIISNPSPYLAQTVKINGTISQIVSGGTGNSSTKLPTSAAIYKNVFVLSDAQGNQILVFANLLYTQQARYGVGVAVRVIGIVNVLPGGLTFSQSLNNVYVVSPQGSTVYL